MPEKPARDEVILVLRQVFSNSSFISTAIPAGLVVMFEEESLPPGNAPIPTLVPQKHGQPIRENSNIPTVLIIGLAMGAAVFLSIAGLIIHGRKREKTKINKLIIGPEGNFSGALAPDMYTDLSLYAGNDFLTDRESESSPLLDHQSKSQHDHELEDSRYTASSQAVSQNQSPFEGVGETTNALEILSLKSVANNEDSVENSVEGPLDDIDIERGGSVHSDISDRSGDYDGSHDTDHDHISLAGQARQEYDEASIAGESKEDFSRGSLEDNKERQCAEFFDGVTAIQVATAAVEEEPDTDGRRSSNTSKSSGRQMEGFAMARESEPKSDAEPCVEILSILNDHDIDDCSQESGSIGDKSSVVDEKVCFTNDAWKTSQIDSDSNFQIDNDDYFSDSSRSEEFKSICNINASEVEINKSNNADGSQDDEVASFESITSSLIQTSNRIPVATQNGDDLLQNASQTDFSFIMENDTKDCPNIDVSYTNDMDASVEFDDDASPDYNENLVSEMKYEDNEYEHQIDSFDFGNNSCHYVERRSSVKSTDVGWTDEIGATALDHRKSSGDEHEKKTQKPEEIHFGYGAGALLESSAIRDESGRLHDIPVVDALSTGFTDLIPECGQDLKPTTTSFEDIDSNDDSLKGQQTIPHVVSTDSSIIGVNAIVTACQNAEQNASRSKETRTVICDERESDTHLPLASRYEFTTIGFQNNDESCQSDNESDAALEQDNDTIHDTEHVKDVLISRDYANVGNIESTLKKSHNDMEMYTSDDDSVSERSWTCDQSVPHIGHWDNEMKNDDGNGDDESERTWSDYGAEESALSRISECAEGSFVTHIEDHEKILGNDELNSTVDKWLPSGHDDKKLLVGITSNAQVNTNPGKRCKDSNSGDEGDDSHQSDIVPRTSQMRQASPELDSSSHSPSFHSDRAGSIYEHSEPSISQARYGSNDARSFQSENNRSYDYSVDSEGKRLERNEFDKDRQSQDSRSFRSTDHSVNSYGESITHSSFHDDANLSYRSGSYESHCSSVNSKGEPTLHRSFDDDDSFSYQSYVQHSFNGDEHNDDFVSNHSETFTKP